MPDKYQALREAISEFDEAAQEYGWASDQGTRSRFARVKVKYASATAALDSRIQDLQDEGNALRSALQDCVAVMENELNGLAVIQLELKKARFALSD